ncbi:MAG: hypothetical protein HY835_04785 [Anaerolineae bacterium]|nr:hypothetical protein [Anaerolineae bacterium]
MRKSILILIVSLVITATAGLTGALMLAQIGPLHVGQPMFQVQELAEETLVLLTFKPEDRAALSMDLLERRLADLRSAPGLSVQLQAVDALQRELMRTANILAKLSGTGSISLRTRFVDLASQARAQLDSLQRLPAVEAARNLAAFLEAVAADTNRPLADLLGQPPTLTATALPSQALLDAASLVNIAAAPIAAHNVVFPPGSAGAQHAFFPLTGKHAALECADCHTQGRYKGTPAECSACHANKTPPNHYPAECSLCHSTDGWTPATFNHSAVDSSNCESCHASKKPANHWPGQCSACHSTQAWKPATFNQQAAGATDCQSCHANKKPANHWNGQCSACHSTNGWTPANFNHQAAGATDCQSCHANRKPANHWNGQCSACHSTNGWRPANFNHAAAGATDCQSCHNRPSNHFGGHCAACHNTNGWRGASFNHAAAGATDCQSCHNRPSNHFAGQCSDCHNTNSWGGASFNHSFPMNHGGANGSCSTCHPGGGSGYTCFGCHDQGKMNEKHKEVGNYSSSCADCHRNGKGD